MVIETRSFLRKEQLEALIPGDIIEYSQKPGRFTKPEMVEENDFLWVERKPTTEAIGYFVGFDVTGKDDGELQGELHIAKERESHKFKEVRTFKLDNIVDINVLYTQVRRNAKPISSS